MRESAGTCASLGGDDSLGRVAHPFRPALVVVVALLGHLPLGAYGLCEGAIGRGSRDVDGDGLGRVRPRFLRPPKSKSRDLCCLKTRRMLTSLAACSAILVHASDKDAVGGYGDGEAKESGAVAVVAQGGTGTGVAEGDVGGAEAASTCASRVFCRRFYSK